MAGGGDGEEPPQVPDHWNAILVGTIGMVLVIQTAFRGLENSVKRKKHSREIMNSMFKELAILGLVAFILFAIDGSGLFDIDANSSHFFEIIHMGLFLVSVLYAVFIGAVVLLSKQVGRQWQIYEDLEFRRYRDLKRQYLLLSEKLGADVNDVPALSKHVLMAIRHPRLWNRWRELAQHVSFHELRTHFIVSNHIPENFHFVTYLKKCKQHVTLDLVEIGEGAWATLAVAISIDLYIKSLSNANNDINILTLCVVMSLWVIFSSLLVYYKVANIFNALVHSEFIKLDGQRSQASFLSNQRSFFWFGRPHLITKFLQFTQFLLSINFTILIQFGYEIDSGTDLAVILIVALLAGSIYILVLPRVIPAFTMVTHVGDLVDRRRLSEALLKQQRSFYNRAVPPTLRQATLLAQLKDERKSLREKIGLLFSHPMYLRLLNVLIIFDFIIIATRTNYTSETGQVDLNWTFIVECILCGAFCLEVALLIYVQGAGNVFSCRNWPLTLDVLVVLLSTLGVIFSGIAHGTGALAAQAIQAVIILRLLRLSRLIKVFIGVGEERYMEGRHDFTPRTKADREAFLRETTHLLQSQSDNKALGGLWAEEGSLTYKSAHSEVPSASRRRVSSSDGGMGVSELRLDGETKSDPVPVGHVGVTECIHPELANAIARQERSLLGSTTIHGSLPSTSTSGIRRVFSSQLMGLIGYRTQHESGVQMREIASVQPPRGSHAARQRNTGGTSFHYRADLSEAEAGSGFRPTHANLPHATVHGSAAVSRLETPQSRAEAGSGAREPITEVWIATCRAHPEITAVQGGLSVPILRIMLGLPAFDNVQVENEWKQSPNVTSTAEEGSLPRFPSTASAHSALRRPRSLHHKLSLGEEHRKVSLLAVGKEDFEEPALPPSQPSDEYEESDSTAAGYISGSDVGEYF